MSFPINHFKPHTATARERNKREEFNSHITVVVENQLLLVQCKFLYVAWQKLEVAVLPVRQAIYRLSGCRSMQDLNWLLDGFPSLLPPDVNSYQPALSSI